MKKKALREVTQKEIVDKFNQGISKRTLIDFTSSITGLKNIESQKIVERFIYEDYMKSKVVNN